MLCCSLRSKDYQESWQNSLVSSSLAFCAISTLALVIILSISTPLGFSHSTLMYTSCPIGGFAMCTLLTAIFTRIFSPTLEASLPPTEDLESKVPSEPLPPVEDPESKVPSEPLIPTEDPESRVPSEPLLKDQETEVATRNPNKKERIRISYSAPQFNPEEWTELNRLIDERNNDAMRMANHLTLRNIDEEQDVLPSQKLQMLKEALKEHEIVFDACSFDGPKFCLPSEKNPYAFFTVPIQIGNILFEVQLLNVFLLKNSEGFTFKYEGEEFSGKGWGKWGIYGNESTPPAQSFKMVNRAWGVEFEKWNRDQAGKPKYLSYTDWMRINTSMEVRKNTVLLIAQEAKDLDNRRISSYYVPDYVSHKLTPSSKFLEITRAQNSSLIEVSSLAFLPLNVLQKIHLKTCAVPLAFANTTFKTVYDAVTQMLTVTEDR